VQTESEENIMSEQVVSVAILEALPGKEEELVTMLREFYAMMRGKGYCTDVLYRGGERPDRLIHLRRWKSAELLAEAQIDPDVHRYWQRLPELCVIPTVYENLEALFES
jgi:quinol monooxygenase YgiN